MEDNGSERSASGAERVALPESTLLPVHRSLVPFGLAVRPSILLALGVRYTMTPTLPKTAIEILAAMAPRAGLRLQAVAKQSRDAGFKTLRAHHQFPPSMLLLVRRDSSIQFTLQSGNRQG